MMLMRAALVVALSASVCAAVPCGAADDAQFPPDKIEQLVAPIALYPDPLLMSMLMASTYPLEVVQADRWLKAQGGKLRGAELDKALEAQTWDDSVKSLAKVPDVLSRMSQNLDWTSDLGDAFLAQQADVLDAVQRMRKRASDQGNLKTTKEQQVVVEKEVIQIVPASPEVIHVPVYSAPVVYGPAWSYPTYYYPPMSAYPPGYVATASLVSFGVGVAVGAAVWGGCNWGNHNVYVGGGWGGGDVNINRNVNINNVNVNRQNWQHNAEHRRGVGYRNENVRQQYRGAEGARRDQARDQARGYDRASGERARTGREGSARASDRAATTGAGERRGGREPGSGARAADRGGERAGARTADRDSERGGSRGGAFAGSNDRGGFERDASARGAASRGNYGPQSGVVEGMVTIAARVEAVDLERRVVTLRGPDGNLVDVEVGDEVRNLAQVRKGDDVIATYSESIAISVAKPGEVKPGITSAVTSDSAKLGDKPARKNTYQTTVTATVVGLNKRASTATIKGPRGRTVTVKVNDPSRLENVKVGDLVEVVYTEAVAISVEKPETTAAHSAKTKKH